MLYGVSGVSDHRQSPYSARANRKTIDCNVQVFRIEDRQRGAPRAAPH
jgi:hypothetical protein